MTERGTNLDEGDIVDTMRQYVALLPLGEQSDERLADLSRLLKKLSVSRGDVHHAKKIIDLAYVQFAQGSREHILAIKGKWALLSPLLATGDHVSAATIAISVSQELPAAETEQGLAEKAARQFIEPLQLKGDIELAAVAAMVGAGIITTITEEQAESLRKAWRLFQPLKDQGKIAIAAGTAIFACSRFAQCNDHQRLAEALGKAWDLFEYIQSNSLETAMWVAHGAASRLAVGSDRQAAAMAAYEDLRRRGVEGRPSINLLSYLAPRNEPNSPSMDH